MYEFVKLGERYRPSSKIRRQGRLVMQACTLLIALLFLSSLAIFSLMRSIEHEGHERLLRSSQIQNSSAQVMLHFRWMVQSWKNVLLRGHQPADGDHYWQELLDHHAKAQQEARNLKKIATPDQMLLIDAYIHNQNNLLEAYTQARRTAQASPAYDYRQADSRVRGLDRNALIPLEKLIQNSQEIGAIGYREHFARIQNMQWASLTLYLILLIGLWIGSLVFVSIRIAKEESLELQNSKMQNLGRMSANIIHEIKNPLTVIDGRCQQLNDISSNLQIPEAQAIQDQLKSLFKVSGRIAKLVNSITRYSRFSNDLAMVPLHCQDIIDDVELIVRSRFKEMDITLQFAVADQLHPIRGRDIEISQILVNLLINASDAVEHLTERWVRVQIMNKDAFVEFRVQDSGSGIPRSILEKLAKNFFTTKDVGKGTGQGLSIARKIIAEHAGYFAYDDTVAHTCFVFGLPKS